MQRRRQPTNPFLIFFPFSKKTTFFAPRPPLLDQTDTPEPERGSKLMGQTLQGKFR